MTIQKVPCLSVVLRKLVPFFISDLRPVKGKHVRMKFDDVDTEEAAKSLVGKKLFTQKELLPELDEGEYHMKDLIGFVVADVNEGELGKLNQVLDQDRSVLV